MRKNTAPSRESTTESDSRPGIKPTKYANVTLHFAAPPTPPKQYQCLTSAKSVSLFNSGDGAHDAALDAPEMTGVRLSKSFAMAAEDIRHLQSRSHDARSAGRHDLQAEPIERTWCATDRLGGDLRITRCAREAGMAKQDLDDAHVRPALQEMGRECVP